MLVVEDEPDIRESLRELLEDEGYAVAVAADGRQALAALPALPQPRVVLLDIIMPVMSGAEFYEALRADPALRDTPVLVSTSDPSRAPAGLPVLRKPIDLRRLLGMLSALFGGAGSATT